MEKLSCIKIAILILICAPWRVCTQNPTFDRTLCEQQLRDDATKQVYVSYERLSPYFEEAYRRYPSIPKGVLEAVSFTYTRFSQPSLDTLEPDPHAMPRTYSVMGLTLHGKNYFRENLRTVARLSGTPVATILQAPRQAILSYAKAFSNLQLLYKCNSDTLETYAPVFSALSELPEGSFPLKLSLYALYHFLADSNNVSYGAPVRKIDFSLLFGADLPLLQNPSVQMQDESPRSAQMPTSANYSNALWRPAAACNYNIGRTKPVSNVVVHYTSGTYAGTIAWFQNCNAHVSAHYVIRSFDGQVTQMVREEDKAWHVGSENGYTIGIEHEAYADVRNFFTPEMYEASAQLVRDICQRRPAISPLHVFYRDTLDDGTVLVSGQHPQGDASACTQIRGHQHYPNQTHVDPGPYWDWNYYYKLINCNTPVHTETSPSGVFTDSGGTSHNYGNNERQLFHVHVENADSVVLDFDSFELESNADYVWIYAGNTVFSPLLGRWNTSSPGRVVAPGSDLMFEFRSDCQGTASGWLAHWYGVFLNDAQDTQIPSTSVDWNEDRWLSSDTVLSFVDMDDVDLYQRFYQILDFMDGVWTANPHHGFLCDNFDQTLDASRWHHNGYWTVFDHKCRNMLASGHSWLSTEVDCSRSNAYLFDFYLCFIEGESCSFCFNVDAVSLGQIHNGYKVVFDKTGNTISICRVEQDVCRVLVQIPHIYHTFSQNYLYRILWDKVTGRIQVYRHGTCLGEVVDPVGLSGGSHMAFFTDNALVSIDNLRSYASRSSSIGVSVGSDDTCMVRSQALNGVARCKIKTLVVDRVGNFSPLVEKLVKVDRTPPMAPGWIVDIPQKNSSEVSPSIMVGASWMPSADPNSEVVEYEYVVVVPDMLSAEWEWNSAGLRTSVVHPYALPGGLNRVQVGVRAKNAAGLCSPTTFSNGIVYQGRTIARFSCLSPNPTSGSFKVSLPTAADEHEQDACDDRYVWRLYDLNGRLLDSGVGAREDDVSLQAYPKGVYWVEIWKNNKRVLCEKIVRI